MMNEELRKRIEVLEGRIESMRRMGMNCDEDIEKLGNLKHELRTGFRVT